MSGCRNDALSSCDCETAVYAIVRVFPRLIDDALLVGAHACAGIAARPSQDLINQSDALTNSGRELQQENGGCAAAGISCCYSPTWLVTLCVSSVPGSQSASCMLLLHCSVLSTIQTSAHLLVTSLQMQLCILTHSYKAVHLVQAVLQRVLHLLQT